MVNWKRCVLKWSLPLRYYSRIFLEGLRKTQRKLSFRIAGARAEIWIRDLPNTKQNWATFIIVAHLHHIHDDPKAFKSVTPESQFRFILMATLKSPICSIRSFVLQVWTCRFDAKSFISNHTLHHNSVYSYPIPLHSVSFWVETTLWMQLSNQMADYFSPLNSVRERSDRLLGLRGRETVGYCVGNWLARAHDFLPHTPAPKTSNTALLGSEDGINILQPAI